MPAGFLFVISEPEEQVSLEEFQDWYNNEHVPLRLNRLPSFLTGARYRRADSAKSSWLAVYDVDDTAAFQHPSYARLRLNRSPREAALVARLELLDRRIYELLSDSGESALTSSYKPTNPTKVIVTQGLSIAPASAESAFRDILRKVAGVEGWVRTRTYKCIDSLRTGTSVGSAAEEQRVPEYLAVHELLSPSVADSPAFLDATAAISHVVVEENWRWELYRAYPALAQGNISDAA